MTRTCTLITCRGLARAAVAVRLLTKPTRRYPPGRIGHILDELRAAAAQDRVQR
jgi:hypothetical protein